MARKSRFALLAALFAVATAAAQARAVVKPSTGVGPVQTVAAPATSTGTGTQAPTLQRLPGNGAVHVNPADPAASRAASAAAAVQPASGVRPTLRNAEDRNATTATQDDGNPTAGPTDSSVGKPPGS
jgi:hypothetical protein